ncbi:hypothetical protein [Streptomyces sp. NBRC 109706]|uniref:hypothetical protein n=1 Tax=Streptomyces sp. NBRC 109706 TaxID=1550035 RepID=UPI000785629D|nr:hypothetical protein [Streptomyces sp. NBRC 109706]
MPDISADYAGIAETSSKLSAQCNIIVPEIYSLLSKVGTLLDNGLYLEQASPALKTAYEEFSRSMQMAASNIQNWANLFTGINDAFKSNDSALFAATLSSIDGEGGLELTADEVETDTPDAPTWGPPGGDLGGTPITWNEDRSSITQG